MMKEEIIIAQECEFWQEGHCDMYYQSSEKYPHCMEYPNCYYKQLKRKEQECEELTQENQEAKEIIAELEYKLDIAKKLLADIGKALEIRRMDLPVRQIQVDYDEMIQNYRSVQILYAKDLIELVLEDGNNE